MLITADAPRTSHHLLSVCVTRSEEEDGEESPKQERTANRGRRRGRGRRGWRGEVNVPGDGGEGKYTSVRSSADIRCSSLWVKEETLRVGKKYCYDAFTPNATRSSDPTSRPAEVTKSASDKEKTVVNWSRWKTPLERLGPNWRILIFVKENNGEATSCLIVMDAT
ncbi:hypothetical protein F2P81_005188 [Scophthalmus maximus]|uniref:Uncharacterized protein n=1 Tax=Scophthalmus maximus TaxID=52904 RepID=A0A6A4T2G3_SCOMX|nr:hypothetical protein F2P81_005188 [Scophthalmus maximus]